MEFQEYRLKQICEIKSGKRIPKGMDFATSITDHPYIRARDIKNGKIQTSDLIYIDETTYGKIKRYIINNGDIAITIAGTVGEVGYAQMEVDGYNLTENAVRLTSYKRYVNGKYLFYLLSQGHYNEYMQIISGGVAQPKLGIYKLERIKVLLPSIDIQNKVVSFLSLFDEVIENNNKRIKILEQMAENLYKEWFVRFRFPGYETAEFVDGVPKGWEYHKLKRLLEIFYGKDHKNISDGNIPVFGSGGIMRYGNKALYEGEVVLIPRKGTLNNIMYYSGKIWTVDTMFYAVSQIHHSAKYIYYTLSNFDMESYNSGAALPSMTTSILYNLKVLLPDKNALKKLDDIVGKIFDEKKCLEMQNQNLIKQRDYLLPRLMSGKLQVK